MQNRMKTISTLAFLIIAQLCFAQKDSSVINNNQTKINELKERLIGLTEQKEKKTFDSSAYKINYMFQEFKKLRLEVNKLNESIKKQNAAKDAIHLTANDGKLTTNKTSIDIEAFYIIVDSERTLERADKKLSTTKNYEVYNIIIIENARRTWYHLVLKEKLTIKQAKKNTNSFRKNGITDAWWTSGKNLMH
jgi:hypothetical protein